MQAAADLQHSAQVTVRQQRQDGQPHLVRQRQPAGTYRDTCWLTGVITTSHTVKMIRNDRSKHIFDRKPIANSRIPLKTSNIQK